MGKKPLGGNQATQEQLLWSVEIAQNPIQQTGSLLQTCLQCRPLGGAYQMRQEIQFPGPHRAQGLAMHVVGDAGLVNLLLRLQPAAEQFWSSNPRDVR